MGVAVGEQSAGTAPPRQTGDPVPSRPRATAAVAPRTPADQLTVCMTCGAEVERVGLDAGGKRVLRPCGHPAQVKLVPKSRPDGSCAFVNHPPNGEIFPLRVTRYDHEIQALRRIVYGYSFECAVHGQGARFASVAAARAGKREHEQGHR